MLLARFGDIGSRVVISLALMALALAGAGSSLAEEGTPASYITDLSQCQPSTALSHDQEQGKWRLIPYVSTEGSGTMLAAASFINASEITLPLRTEGWHGIWLGVWNPAFAYDGSPALKVRLSGDAAFRQLHQGGSPDSQEATFLREIYYGDADLTGQDLVIGKMNGPLGRSAFLAYVKLVPLPPANIEQVLKDRERTDTRNLVATIDGMSYFHYGEYSRSEHILEQVELYRHSDVGKVLWAVSYGDLTNFPASVPDARFVGDHNRQRYSTDAAANDYARGEKQMYTSLRTFAKSGVMPQQVAAEHVHGMGLKFDLMIRLGMLGDLGFLDLADDGFVSKHPEYCQVLSDGTVVSKASYAFQEVQDFSCAIIRDALAQVDADGVNLCFVRGPHLLQYEEPVLSAFLEEHNEDARNVDVRDARLLKTRADIMTRYVRNVRALLDDIGAARGRRLDLSVWVWPGNQGVWLGGTPFEEGLDVKAWIREGLLDSVICQEGVDEEYTTLGKTSDCEFVLYTGYRGDKAMSPKTVTQAYEQGVNAFAYWDMDAVQNFEEHWNWLRRIGHRDEMADWENRAPKSRLIKLTEIGGINVEKGLADGVYSGG